MISPARLRKLVRYDPQTGIFISRVARTNRLPAGRQLGSIFRCASLCYFQIRIDGHCYLAHRLAWLYVYERWPSGGLDHIDGDGLNNRIANLREATQSQNMANARRRRTNRSGFKGVNKEPNGRYRAKIRIAGKTIHIGRFATADEARQAYLIKARELFGEFANAG